MAKFSDVFEDVTKQGRKIPKEQYLSEGSHPIIDQGQNQIAGYWDEDDGLFCDVPAIIFGDHTRILKYIDTPFFLGADGVKVLRAKKEDANCKYLFYALCNVKIPDTGYNRHFKWLKESEIEMPSDEEQKRIVCQLEKLEKLISQRKHQLAKLDELVKARFVEMFGTLDNSKYETQKIRELVDVCSGGTPKRDKEAYWKSGTIPWVKTTELKNTVIIDIEESITELGLHESSARLVPAGTILIAMYGQGKTRGMTGYLGVDACTNQACACLIPKQLINQKYLWHYLILSYEKLRGLAQGGNQPNLNADMIKNFDVILPPKEEQNAFVEFAEQIDKSKLTVQQSLDKLEVLKKKLMQEYFG